MGVDHNKIQHDKILKEVSRHFTIVNKIFLDGYFIFDLGKDAICHFRLKETPDWLYGIWLEEDGSFRIIGEHDDLVDKFKPSRTYISIEDNIQEFIELVNEIKNDSKLYFVDSLTGDALIDYKIEVNDGYTWATGYQVVYSIDEDGNRNFSRDKSVTQEEFVKKEYDEFIKDKLKRISDEESDKELVFNFLKSLLDLYDSVLAIGVYDQNTDNVRVSPRYKVKIVIGEDFEEISINDFYEELLEAFDDISQNKKTYEYQIRLEGLYNSVRDISKASYKYFKTQN